jgi:hypothetical protein
MAKTTGTTAKPASKGAKPAVKPAAKEVEPAVAPGVGIKELSAALGRSPKSVRASIRRIKGGAQVGQGGRYRWESISDPEYVALLDQLQAPSKSDDEDE